MRDAYVGRLDFAPSACRPCVPSPACKEGVRAWAKRHGDGFFVGKGSALKRLTFTMPALLQCVEKHTVPTVIDVGAAMHGQAGSIKELEKVPFLTTRRGQPLFHPDDSDALLMLSVFGERAHVHAFEPNVKAATALEVAARRRFATRNFTHRLDVHKVGVGDKWMQTNATACGRLNRFTVRTEYGVGAEFRGCHRVNVTTLDAFGAARKKQLRLLRQEQRQRGGGGGGDGDGGMLYIKVDVEGGEWAVLDGAQRLLRTQSIEIMSIEYAVGWHRHFHLARPLTRDERAEVTRPLQKLVARLYAWGYDTYLLHARSISEGVTLVPIYGRWWHDDFEICFNRSTFYGKWGWGHSCWNDLLVVRRCNRCVRRVLFEEMLPRTDYRHKARGMPLAPLGAAAFPDCGCL